MKFSGLIVAVVVLAALVGTLYWSNHHKPAETAQASADAPPKILSLNEADVHRVELKKKESADTVLTKDSSGKWQIDGPKPLAADSSAVSGVLSALSSLTAERLVDEKAADLNPYGLSVPAMEVGLVEKDNKTHTLLIGDDTPTSSGTYAKLAGDPRVFTIAKYTKNSLEKGVDDLRDKRLITVDADKISRLDLRAGKQEIEFGRNKDQWEIVKPRPLRADGFAVDDLVRKITEAKMDLGSADDAKKSASAFASGSAVAVAKMTTEAGTQILEIHKNKDDYYAKSSVVDGVYKIGNDVAQGLDKKLDDFRNKKLFDFGYTDPDKIELHDGSKAFYLTRGGQSWWSGDGKKLDPSSADSVVEKVRDLQASKFADSGFGSPIFGVAVTSNGGKRVEKVEISKNGDQYLAKRKDEPALYEIDATAITDLQKAAADLKPEKR